MIIVVPRIMYLIGKIGPIQPYAITLYPFIFCQEEPDSVTINHESIHLKQQKELLILGFYVLYLLSYLKNLLKGMDGEEAYRNIIFEREAYSEQRNETYLENRKFWAWRKY